MLRAVGDLSGVNMICFGFGDVGSMAVSGEEGRVSGGGGGGERASSRVQGVSSNGFW